MANSSPHVARLAKRRAHKPGNLADLTRVLWTAIRDAEYLLYSAEDSEFRLRCIHAICQASGAYAKLLEVGEFEARLKALEDASVRNGH